MRRGDVYRIQDADGRGPWKPGFSKYWVEDRDDLDNLVPFFLECPQWRDAEIVGMPMGSACLSVEQLTRWFTPTEYLTLLKFGYRAVKMCDVMIIAESTSQCVFQRAKPLHQDVEIINLYSGAAA